jgi:hypothetical protein
MVPASAHSVVKPIADKPLTCEMCMLTNFILIFYKWPHHIMWSHTIQVPCMGPFLIQDY